MARESNSGRIRTKKGVPKQSLSNWVRLAAKGTLQGAGDRPASTEQMALARLRAV